MICECAEHGYFTGRACPLCGEEGKLILNNYETEKVGRTLAAVLRHGKYDLEMDSEGYVRVKDIVRLIQDRNPRMKWFRPHHIEALVDTDTKGIYQLLGESIRAMYGHTVNVELNLPIDNVAAVLFKAVPAEDYDALMKNGILPNERAKVHLSRTFDDAYRAGLMILEEPMVLAVNTERNAEEGYPVGKASEKVFLCDKVLSGALSKAERPSKRYVCADRPEE